MRIAKGNAIICKLFVGRSGLVSSTLTATQSSTAVCQSRSSVEDHPRSCSTRHAPWLTQHARCKPPIPLWPPGQTRSVQYRGGRSDTRGNESFGFDQSTRRRRDSSDGGYRICMVDISGWR